MKTTNAEEVVAPWDPAVTMAGDGNFPLLGTRWWRNSALPDPGARLIANLRVPSVEEPESLTELENFSFQICCITVNGV